MRAAKLPPNCKYINEACELLRTQLEAALGDVSIHQAALINSAIRHEKMAALADRWLRLKLDSMTLSEITTVKDWLMSSTTARDRCIRDLQIDASQVDVWSAPSPRLPAWDDPQRALPTMDDTSVVSPPCDASEAILEGRLDAGLDDTQVQRTGVDDADSLSL